MSTLIWILLVTHPNGGVLVHEFATEETCKLSQGVFNLRENKTTAWCITEIRKIKESIK